MIGRNQRQHLYKSHECDGRHNADGMTPLWRLHFGTTRLLEESCKQAEDSSFRMVLDIAAAVYALVACLV